MPTASTDDYDSMESGANRVRALIVDDEELGRRRLRSLLASDADIEVVGEAESAPEARRKIAAQHPDLVFLDIEMSGGSGIELLQDLDEPLPYVIFVTAHPECALPAFELHAADYVVKPVERQRFARSISRAKRRICDQRVAGLTMRFGRAVDLIGNYREPVAPAPEKTYSKRMTIRVRRRTLSLKVSDISWIQGASQYSRIYSKDGQYLLARTLASLECELDPTRFFRVHRSSIVNVAHVREVRTTGEGRYIVHLHGGQTLPMGRARRDILQRLLISIDSQAI